MSPNNKRTLEDFTFEKTGRKRSRTSPVPDLSNSSATSSNPAMSEVSAMQSTPPHETYRRSTSVTSVSEEGSDSSESDSSSSEEEEDSDDSADDTETNEDVVTIGGPAKPAIRKPKTDAFDLKSRLAAFLPQLAAANSELERLRAAGQFEGMSMEDVNEEEGGYIEMDLGLGVLEEKKEGEESDEEEEDADAEMMDEEGRKQKEKDVLGRMMGFKGGRQAAGIEEVDGA